LQPFVEVHTRPDATVNTDEWRAYAHLPETGRSHATVCHMPGRREWARDDDGDGVREVHNNTMEGIWTGLRNFLRPFRGVSKWFLSQYVTIFEWAHNLKRVTTAFLRAMMVPCTSEPT
jgi:transposase-like protein